MDEAEGILDEIADDPSIFTSDEDPFAGINSQLKELGLTSCT
jgi:hypothetical protein